jgi:tocopherol O-methyltransferase
MIESKQRIAGEDVARHYDELDAFYRDVWGEHVHHGLWLRGDESQPVAVRQLAELVANEAAIGLGTRVIDIGCGYGATARMLAEERGAQVTAITISAAQHAIAGQGKSSSFSSSSSSSQGAGVGGEKDEDEEKDEEEIANPRFLLGDWLTNDLPEASFDAAISIESSEHMPDKPGFFAEAHRVLVPGGRLVICAWLSAERPTARQERWLIEPICREGRMPHLGSESDYRQLAATAGFSVERVEDVTRQIARTWPMIVRTFLVKLLHKPAYLRFLLDRHAHNRIFALTTVRLWIAFRTGAMRYGVFTLRK